MIWTPQKSENPNNDYMGDHYFLAFLVGDNPQNPEICKSQREINIFLLFWSRKSLFSLSVFWQATILETRKSANHNGRSLFSCFFGMGNHYFLVFFGGDDPRNPEICKSQREITIFLLFWSGKSLFSYFFGGDDPRNPEICKSQREITIFLLFWSGKSLFSCLFLAADNRRNPIICKSQREITIFLLFWSGKSLFSCLFLAGDDPRNPIICKSQREITIFLLFWSGKY